MHDRQAPVKVLIVKLSSLGDVVHAMPAVMDIQAAFPNAQIDWVVSAYTRGVVADEQMSALLMAILLNGMNTREITRWTNAMINSGERLNWSKLISIQLVVSATKLLCRLLP